MTTFGTGTFGSGTFANPGPSWSTTVAPDTISDAETLNAPQVTQDNAIAPAGITDAQTIGQPGVTAAYTAAPAAITDASTLGAPTVITGAAVGPAAITDAQTLGGPATVFTATPANYSYGTDIYGAGPYQPLAPTPEDPTPDPVPDPTPDPTEPPVTNFGYGAAVYGEGVYSGGPQGGTPDPDAPVTTEPGPQNLPLFAQVPESTAPPLHVLGIGPWSPLIRWRGAPNIGVKAGQRPSRPVVALPEATAKSFTLRVNDASEATMNITTAPGQAVLIDEMDTDLWWRRKDPRTGKLEMIGRFNASHVDVQSSDTGISLSCQFEDYRSVLGDRLVLKYLHPDALPGPESAWDEGTKITDVIAWALPDNTGLDLSEATGDDPYDLGTIVRPFPLPPGTSIADLFDSLLAISPIPWEWWVETPASVDEPPKLRFVLGQRGADRGVTLIDHGAGPTPIASWQRVAASADYANSLYYTARDSGVVDAIPAQIRQYGQRDAQASNSTLGGEIELIRRGAAHKLAALADRTPTFTVSLRPGFWRGRSHIDVGDLVRLIIKIGGDVIDVKYRVAEIHVEIDENNTEQVTLTLGKTRASANPRSKRAPLIRILRYLRNWVTPPGSTDIPEINADG